MESSIASHLICPRTRQRRVEDDYAPPYPCWSARGPAGMKQVVMGYFGVQSKGQAAHGQACAALVHILASFRKADGPRHVDTAHFVDAQGYDNMVAIAYWDDPATCAGWRGNPEVDAWWSDPAREREGIGYFREILSPRVEHYETMFNTPDRLEGVGAIMGSISGDIREHGYWGSARDRIPLAQTDALVPSGKVALAPGSAITGARVRVKGHDNVAIIRSGQEWTETQGKERDLYLGEMEPVLRKGMDFLHGDGRAIGCYSNRYMNHLDASGNRLEKTFGVSLWRSLADLERWSESHPTHVAIFGTFMRIVQELQFQLSLRVYHEVSVLKPDEQEYEYVGCHPRTGMLAALAA